MKPPTTRTCLESRLLAPFLDDVAAAVSGSLDVFTSHSLTLEQIDVAIVDGAAREHHAMRVESRGSDGCGARRIAHAQIAHVGLEAGQVLETGVVDADGMVRASGGKDRRVLVHRERAEVARLAWVTGQRGDRTTHSDVPESDATVAFGRDELAHAAALEVDADDPAAVVGATVDPVHDHGVAGPQALVVGAHAAVAEPCDEYVAFDLI